VTQFVESDLEGNNAQKSPAVAKAIVAHICRDGSLGSFLDVGCGSGSLLAAAAPFAADLTGVDRSEYFVSKARAALPAARILEADVADLSALPENHFDTVAFLDVIEHLGNPVAALGELRRVLRPGGRLVITTPNSDSIQRVLFGNRWNGLVDPTHILLYTRFHLDRLARTFRLFDQATSYVIRPVPTGAFAGRRGLLEARVDHAGFRGEGGVRNRYRQPGVAVE
jgi:SAM-dependent methyltransferase